ncbi:MAG TPA: sigma-70 family RNA polymerase sigma factor [Gemmataceae bacterium]|nr:sigma-70 family RNA polymerase sigma factor [Gemmataceae bacterium]
MAGGRLKDVLRRFNRQLAAPAISEWTDRQLLERFASRRDEMAFASIVRRHGPLVLGAGRRILHRDQDAEDVFQATFLILARKAASGRWRKSVAGWLYCVASRLARRTKAKTLRQRELHKEAGTVLATRATSVEDRRELYTVLDEELNRLSDRCREPLLLCYLEGRTRDQAARQLGWSLRTLERRLEKGLKLLRVRLCRRGIELPVALLAAGLSQQAASAHLSVATVATTVEAAVAFGSGVATVGAAISATAVALAEGGLKAMVVTKMKIGVVLLLAASVVLAGVGLVGHRLWSTEQAKKNPAAEERTVPTLAAAVWPEGTTVKGRVVDHRGNAVANAEVLLLGKEHIIVDAEPRTWFVREEKDHSDANDDLAPPSVRTNAKGEFTIKRNKGTADRLAVIAEDPLLWTISRKNLKQDGYVEIKLPQAGSLAISCNLPGKAAKQPVNIELRTLDGTDWVTDVLRFHSGSFSVKNPGETVFEHLPPGQYAVAREQQTQTGKNTAELTDVDRQLAKVESNKRVTIGFERKIGRPLIGRVKGLEKIDLRYARVTIRYPGPEEQLERSGRRERFFTAFDVLPITSDGRFTTDPIPPGKYYLDLFAICSSTPDQSSGESDFNAWLLFTVPERGDMPKIEVVAKPNTRKAPLPTTNCVRVVDEAGKPLPAMQATIHAGKAGYGRWANGRDGVVGFDTLRTVPDADAVDVLVRADGYATAVTRFESQERNQLRQGKATITMQRGHKVELSFRLPQGMTWPSGVLPETYFEDYQDYVRMMRNPDNRQYVETGDFNMLNVRPISPGRFELRVTPETPPFHVAIQAPGFMQYFESGPFRLADAKDGKLEIVVPRPAGLDVRFDPAVKNAEDAPFKGALLQVMWRIPGTTGSFSIVATKDVTSANDEFKLTDLAPGTYQVDVYTSPKRDAEAVLRGEINPGYFRDLRELTLNQAQSESVRFRYQPPDPNAFRGQRTALLRFRMPDGTPAKDHRLKVGYHDGHYGYLPVFSGSIPDSGTLTLKGLTDRVAHPSAYRSYKVEVDDELVGSFGFTKEQLAQEFDFQLPPRAGDLAPDVELRAIASGTPMRLSSLRGKIVCLEFWATWCGPCQPAMAKLSRLAEEHGAAWKDRVAIVPISIDAKPERVKSHVAQRGWNRLEHYWAGKSTRSDFDAPAARAFVVWGVPTAILVGRDGRILWRGHPLDETGGQNLQSRIEAALKK